MLKKFIRSKLRALKVLALFSSGIFWKPEKKTAKSKEAFEGKFVVIVEVFAR